MVSQFQDNFSYQMKIEHLLWLFLLDRAPVSSQSCTRHTHLKNGSLVQSYYWININWWFQNLWRSWSFSKVVRQPRFCPDTKVPLLETNDLSMLAGILLKDSQFRSCWKFVNQACSNYIFHRMKPECIKTNYLTPRVASLVLDKIHFDSIHLEPAPCSHSHTCR